MNVSNIIEWAFCIGFLGWWIISTFEITIKIIKYKEKWWKWEPLKSNMYVIILKNADKILDKRMKI